MTERCQSRLFHLHYDTQAGPLCGHFSVVSLTELPGYYALSYAWGQPSLDEEYFVHCGNRRFEITKNLYDFLIRHREAQDQTPLWIDALCINQYDDQEKSYQIPNMGDVYSKAETVIIWLGLADEDTPPVLNLLSLLKAANDAIEKHGGVLDKTTCLSSCRTPTYPLSISLYGSH